MIGALFPDARPLAGLAGGALIGLAGALLLLGAGRIAGVTGMLGRAAGLAGPARRGAAAAFVLGLPLGALGVGLFGGGVEAYYPPALVLAVAGLLVGYGTRMGSGCTSGHGVCGLSRLSRRSIAATSVFMGSGVATVAVMRLGGWL